MKLNHINLGVTEIASTVAMFETYFGLKPMGLPVNEKMAFLTDDAGAVLSLFRVKDATYPKIFHIGFIQESTEQVLAIHGRLAQGGFDPEEPREEHGRFTFYFKAPGGFTVEVNAFV